MQFLISVIADGTEVEGETEAADIDAINERMQADGQRLFAGGMGSPETALTIDNRDGQAHVSDGPYVQTKEFVAGLWIINAPDLETAVNLGVDASVACNRRIEVRAFLHRDASES